MPQEKVSFIQRKPEIRSQNILCRNDAQNLWKFCSLQQRKLEHGAPTCTDYFSEACLQAFALMASPFGSS